MKPGIRQTAISASVFGIVLMALASFDPRVRDRFVELLNGSTDASLWTDRFGTLVETIATALRHQSVENAPMVVFATVGAVLVLFMVKT